MRTNTILMVAALICSAPPALADKGDVYRISDRDGDGHVDRREFQQRQVDLFMFHDADKDGNLSAGELGADGAATVRAGDRDGDGKLQLEEFLDLRALVFSEADTDNTGTLSESEVEAVGP